MKTRSGFHLSLLIGLIKEREKIKDAGSTDQLQSPLSKWKGTECSPRGRQVLGRYRQEYGDINRREIKNL